MADASTALLFNQSDPYSVSNPAGGVHACSVIDFDNALAVDIAASVDPAAVDRPQRPFARAEATIPATLAYRHHHLRAQLRAGCIGDLGAQEEAIAILLGVLTTAHGGRHGSAPCRARATRRAHRELAESVREHLAGSPGVDHTLSTLARSHGVSGAHLARVFRECTGVPIHRHLLRLRLSLALERLAERNVNIGTLAIDLGFSSHSHFSSSFRDAYGVSPRAANRVLSTVNGRARLGLAANAARSRF
jgi:AraC family transcriptional regulator